MSSFGDLVRRLRKDRGLTLEQVARKIGSHKGYVSGIENGKVNPPSVKFIRKFAKLFQHDEKEMVRIASVDKVPALVREEFRALLAGSAPAPAADAVGVPLLNTVETGYATELTDGRPQARTSTTLMLPRFGVDVQFAATMCDASMDHAGASSFPKGAIVLLTSAPKISSGATFYVVYRKKGRRNALVRQALLQQNDHLILQPLNKEYPAETITLDDVDAAFRVAGRIEVFEGAPVSASI